MGVGRQSRRVCFAAKPDKGFLDKKISPYPEVVRGRERELVVGQERGGLVAGTRERQLVAGEQRESWWQESREAVGGRREQRESWWLETSRGVGGWGPREVVGQERGELVAGQERRQLRLDRREANREVGVDPRRGSQHQTPSREARRQDRVQWRRVSKCLIPVALWNFR